MRDRILLAERHHLADAGHCEPRLHRAGLVVEPAVEHSAIVSGLVAADGVFLLEHGDARIGKLLPEAVGRRQSDDATADDNDVAGLADHARAILAARELGPGSPGFST